MTDFGKKLMLAIRPAAYVEQSQPQVVVARDLSGIRFEREMARRRGFSLNKPLWKPVPGTLANPTN